MKVILDTDTMYYKWQKGTMVQLTDHFWSHEFDCPGDKVHDMQVIHSHLVSKLEDLRKDVGIPIKITSGYRSQAYQDYLTAKGYETAKKSQHLLGNAADLTCRDMHKLIAEAPKYFKAIGIGTSFIHVDLRNDKERRWYYF